MASNIDATKPADNVKADKADLRANLQAAKNENEELQRQVSHRGNRPLYLIVSRLRKELLTWIL